MKCEDLGVLIVMQELIKINQLTAPGDGEGMKRWHKGSHLHQLKPVADPNGNRAERREAKKVKKKKGR